MIPEVALVAFLACNGLLTSLFTPARPSVGRYEVCTTGDSQDVVRAEGSQAGTQWAPIETLEALDAFGAAGSYRRSALAQLYGGTRVRVSHGWIATPDRFESLTLLSPYPDASLTHLVNGTMVIRYSINHSLGPHPQVRGSAPATPSRQTATGGPGSSVASNPTIAHRAVTILISPFTTSRDITGSPVPIVASAKRGPNLSALVSGRSDVMVPFKVTARMRALPGRWANRT